MKLIKNRQKLIEISYFLMLIIAPTLFLFGDKYIFGIEKIQNQTNLQNQNTIQDATSSNNEIQTEKLIPNISSTRSAIKGATFLFIFLYIGLFFLRNVLLGPFLFLPAVFISKSNKANYNHLKMDFQKELDRNSTKKRYEEITLVTKDKIKINAFKIFAPNQYYIDGEEFNSDVIIDSLNENNNSDDNTTSNITKILDPEKQKWILFVNPNAAAYEEMLIFLEKYGRTVGANVICFNYRGVGLSEGSPTLAEQLIEDCDTVMNHLLSRGVPSKNVMVHGWSMGGGVGSIVRSYYPDGPMINDRSFRSLGHISAHLATTEPLGQLIGGLFGAISGAFFGIFASGASVPLSILSSAVGVGVFSFAKVYKTKPYKWFCKSLINYIGWRLDAHDAWSKIKGKKCIIYHQLDGIIHYEGTSLAVAVKNQNDLNKLQNITNAVDTHYIHLQYKHFNHSTRSFQEQADQIYHCYNLDLIDNEWNIITRFAKDAFKDINK